MRQMQKRKAKLKLGDQKLTKYERFIRTTNADRDAIAKESDKIAVRGSYER